MRRRDFIERLPIVPAGMAASASLLSIGACAGAPYIVPRQRPGGLLVSAAALTADEGIFVQGPGMERPLYLTRGASGEVTAVLASCTHQGCQPEPIGGRLVCPCHGSEFALDGSLLGGPADRPLLSYRVSEEGDDLVVWLEGGAAR